ncbi:MAG: hypothetical protein QW376_09040 [Candidatus Caldarchaeum sp.]
MVYVGSTTSKRFPMVGEGWSEPTKPKLRFAGFVAIIIAAIIEPVENREDAALHASIIFSDTEQHFIGAIRELM